MSESGARMGALLAGAVTQMQAHGAESLCSAAPMCHRHAHGGAVLWMLWMPNKNVQHVPAAVRVTKLWRGA